MQHNSHKLFSWRLMTLSLLLISALQTTIYGIVQIGNHSVSLGHPSWLIPLNAFFYSVMVVTSVYHPFIMRRFSLKFALLAGLFSDLLSVSFMWINEAVGGSVVLLVLSFLFAGIAIVSVINCLVTYMVIEFPRSLSLAMLVLFLFSNLGYLVVLVYNLFCLYFPDKFQ